MYKATLLFILIVLSLVSRAQSPQKMSFQALIRNTRNEIISKNNVSLRISIIQGGNGTSPVYSEIQTVMSDVNGLVSLQIGMGTNKTGVFSMIDWAHGPFYIKTEADPNGGSDYSIVGSTELLSVPYALFALNTDIHYYIGTSTDLIDASKLNLGQDFSIYITKGLIFASIGHIIVSEENHTHFEGQLQSYDKISGLLKLKISEIVGDKTNNFWTIKMNGNRGFDGLAGLNGKDGVNGTNGIKGDTGSPGINGQRGDTGWPGTNGSNGRDGSTGPMGLKGDNGSAGINGINGNDGPRGPTGLKGDIGLTGNSGINGSNGLDGTIGATGLKGDTGLTGLKGDIGLTGNNGTNGSNGLDGAKGETGLKGDTGLTGLKGDIGLTGNSGTNGSNGLDGAIGATGLKGDTGFTGLKGDIGLTGNNGTNGSNGLDGAIGATGLKGDTGLTGLKGDTGLTGTSGTNGSNGIDGSVGATGLKGDTGLTGLKGDTGLTGTSGTNGLNGTTGATGLQGDIGLTGPKGDTGLTGATGLKGDPGTNGIDGVSGGEPVVAAGTTSQYYRGDKSWQLLNATAVGLTNVNNTSDANKIISIAAQSALDLKAPITSPDLKGTPLAPTAASGTNTDQIATTAFVLANTDKYQSVTAGNEITTTSNSDVVADGMTLSPPAGKYFVTFNAQYTIESGNRTSEASTNLDNAYTYLMSKPVTNSSHSVTYGAGETLSPGVYANVGAVTATGTLTLDANNDPNAEFVFQFGAAFSTAAAFNLVLLNGASPCRIYWVAEGAIALGAGTSMQGMLLSNNGAVTMGALATITGSLYTRAGAIGIDASTITKPSGCVNSFGSLNNFSIFTKVGDVTNTGSSNIAGDIATKVGSVTGFASATLGGSIYLSGLGDATANFSIYQNGSQIPFSNRKRTSIIQDSDIHLEAISTINAGESIDIRWKIDSGNVKLQNRILTLIQVK